MNTTKEPIIKQIKNIKHVSSTSWIDGIKLYAQQYFSDKSDQNLLADKDAFYINNLLKTDFLDYKIQFSDSLKVSDHFLETVKSYNDSYIIPIYNSNIIYELVDLPENLTLENSTIFKNYLGSTISYKNFSSLLNFLTTKNLYLLSIPNDYSADKPIVFLNYCDNLTTSINNTRCALLAGTNSQLTINEVFTGRGQYIRNSITEVFLQKNSCIDFLHIDDDSDSSHIFSNFGSSLSERSILNLWSSSIGGSYINSSNFYQLIGEESTFKNYGLNFSSHNQIYNYTSSIEHLFKSANSEQVQKSISDDSSKINFSGTIFVEKECVHTDAKQLLRGLQLSPKSKINLSPEMQILADDVKCAHGATIGQINDDELFYLESRGIDKISAKKMLLESFFADLFIGINQKSNIINNLMKKIKGKLKNV